jgi:putative peptidoglycan lipid II flippase
MSAPAGSEEIPPSTSRSLLSSSAVMAAGTVVSRLSGFVRGTLLIAALGAGLHGDVFNIANTVPNMLYILLAGGVVNAVLVPQLVRAMRNDADGGEAYTNRVITLAGMFLLVVTLLLVAAAPVLMNLFLTGDFFTPARHAQLESVITFARYCLPQVFFYGMFVLVGQVLNARGRFGPMMWAPIANNVVSVAVLVAYLLTFGAAQGPEKQGGFGSGQELLLGLGSTAGIVVQLLVLVPYLRASGFRFKPRFDFRGSGLGHTLRLGLWTVLFVIVNQVAYTVVVRLASTGTVGGHGHGTGYTVYSNAFLLTQVPHSIITVSLATAMLPLLSRYAAEQDLRGFYALEQNRRVFFIQCGVSATNVVVALLLVLGAPVAQVAPRLVLAYACSYAVGAALSYTLLAREVGGLAGRVLVRFLVRLAIAVGLSAALAWGVRTGLGDVVPAEGWLHAVLDLVVAGAVFLAAYLGLARALRLSEVNDVMALVTRRLPGRR